MKLLSNAPITQFKTNAMKRSNAGFQIIIAEYLQLTLFFFCLVTLNPSFQAIPTTV